MTKGIKIAIGVTLGVSLLGVATYIIFFRKKSDDKKSDNIKEGSDTGFLSDKKGSVSTLYKGKMAHVENVKDAPRLWVNLKDKSVKKDRFVKNDVAVIEGTSFDGEYPIYATWIDINGNIGAISLDINKKYTAINSKDETFSDYATIKVIREIK